MLGCCGRMEEAATDARVARHHSLAEPQPATAHNHGPAKPARAAQLPPPTGGQLPEVQVLHVAGGDQRLLGVVQHVALRVHAHLVVGHVHAWAAVEWGGGGWVSRRVGG